MTTSFKNFTMSVPAKFFESRSIFDEVDEATAVSVQISSGCSTPVHLNSAPTDCQHLKPKLFSQSYPKIIIMPILLLTIE